MITAGIDLASQPLIAALCVIDWSSSPVQTTRLQTYINDDAVELVTHDVDKLGVDGWQSRRCGDASW